VLIFSVWVPEDNDRRDSAMCACVAFAKHFGGVQNDSWLRHSTFSLATQQRDDRPVFSSPWHNSN
jgi:hypothetical protein